MTENKTTTINPRLLSGFRDFLPEKKKQRDQIIEKVRVVYESFGFQPLETPVLEYTDILTGKYGDEAARLMYRFKDKGDRDVAMRYDLTVPFARVIAQYPELAKPFKRYQVAPVWRADSPQAGRYREFYQMDADIAGSASTLADAEIVNLIYATMTNLNIEKFNIRLNNRKILNGLIEYAGIEESYTNKVFQIIDKIEKIDALEFKKLLEEIVGQESAEKVIEFTSFKGKNSEIITNLKKIFADITTGLEGTTELEETIKFLELSKIDMSKIKIDLSIARGLDYYTGLVFETILLDAPEFGSVFSGGRYDKMIGTFTGIEMPAIGTSIGIDRLFAALEKLELLPAVKSETQVLVTVLPENPEESLKVAQVLRDNNIKTELYLGEKPSPGPQLAYADKLGIPIAIICFPDKVKENIYIVKKLGKNLGEAEQVETSFEKLVETVKNI
jgi:histidyl-tRNA synthetase